MNSNEVSSYTHCPLSLFIRIVNALANIGISRRSSTYSRTAVSTSTFRETLVRAEFLPLLLPRRTRRTTSLWPPLFLHGVYLLSREMAPSQCHEFSRRYASGQSSSLAVASDDGAVLSSLSGPNACSPVAPRDNRRELRVEAIYYCVENTSSSLQVACDDCRRQAPARRRPTRWTKTLVLRGHRI